jgi:hypothetical protein
MYKHKFRGNFYSFQETTIFSLPRIMLKPSAMIRNRKGDKGHPCLNPLEDLKKEDNDPLIKKENEVDSTHPMIQLTKIRFIPILIRASLRNTHLTLSYAFDMSTSTTKVGNIFYLMEWSASCTNATTS